MYTISCLAIASVAAADPPKPVKVFLLAGQSNMEGKGAVNTLPWLGEDPEYGHLLADIRDGDGWRVRDDVFIEYLGRSGPLAVGYGSDGGPHGKRIGPEYGFGMIAGDHFDEPVLLIKTAWGGKDVANDFRSPSRGEPGPFYTEMIDRTRDVMARASELFPDLAGRELQLAGFVWFQGWNDMVNKEKTAAYIDNLAQMIRDLRRDLNAPDLPVVIGELGVDGIHAKGNIATFRAQQRAVAELPEFVGNVRFVPTAPYWDDIAHELYKQDVWKGPDKKRFYRIASDRPYHYLGSGKIYYLIGRALGIEMLGLLAASPTGAAGSDEWVTYMGHDGPGHNKHIVLISGDEEYRSEEALPQLGKILTTRHGFKCTVLFAIDPDTGTIDPNNRRNIPGLAALDNADLLIIATRFRDLPDAQMAHIDAYLKAGKPVIGLRTATHGFNIESSPTYQHYTWNSSAEHFKQGFGRQILGETWVAHHGHHGRESTRGLIAEDAKDHAIVRGIRPRSIWGPTDVYRVRLPLPGDCRPIVLGQVLAGMSQDDEPVVGEKNDPIMPVGWIKTYSIADGPRGRVFTTTMGAATDLIAEGTRRMLVNAVYWALGMEDEIPQGGTDVGIVGKYEPTDFGFGGFLTGVRPSDHALRNQ